jgi:shikimate 5-dehydrogenase
MTISGRTKLIAHLGFPTESFKAPMIYNPYFEKYDIDAVVVPMGCKADDYSMFLKLLFRLSNIHGALVTMPHKVTTISLLDEVLTTAKVAGACNAIRLGPGGTLVGDMFDGEGFVRGLLHKGRALAGARVLVVGSGGVGSAIVASLAKAGVAVRRPWSDHERLGGTIAHPLSGAEDRAWLPRSRRVRCRRQRDPPRHEGR